MCDKAVDNFLLALQFVANRFVISKMIKKLHNALFADDDIFFFDEDSGNVTIFSDEMGIRSVNNNNIDFDNVNFDEDNPETITHARLMALRNRRIAFKKMLRR